MYRKKQVITLLWGAMKWENIMTVWRWLRWLDNSEHPSTQVTLWLEEKDPTQYEVEKQALRMAENSERNSAQLKKMQGLDPFLSLIQRDTLEEHQGWFLTKVLCA